MKFCGLIHIVLLYCRAKLRRLVQSCLSIGGGQFNSDSENNSENPSEFLDMSKLKIFEFFYITFWQDFGIILRIILRIILGIAIELTSRLPRLQ